MDAISPAKVVEILKRHGTIVTLEEAKIILEFLTMLARLEVAQILKN